MKEKLETTTTKNHVSSKQQATNNYSNGVNTNLNKSSKQTCQNEKEVNSNNCNDANRTKSMMMNSNNNHQTMSNCSQPVHVITNNVESLSPIKHNYGR